MDESLKTLGLFLTLQLICRLAWGIAFRFSGSHSHERWCCGGEEEMLVHRGLLFSMPCSSCAGEPPERHRSSLSPLPHARHPHRLRHFRGKGISADGKSLVSAATAVLELRGRTDGVFL